MGFESVEHQRDDLHRQAARAMDEGTAVPTMTEGVNNADVTPQLIKAIQEATNDDDAFAAVERAASSLPSAEKEKMITALNTLEQALKEDVTTNVLDAALAGVTATAWGSVLLLLTVAPITAVALPSLSSIVLTLRGLDRADQAEKQERIERLKTALSSPAPTSSTA